MSQSSAKKLKQLEEVIKNKILSYIFFLYYTDTVNDG